ncbi:MAG: DUF4093 domain-containing protein [Clostridia bacterium]|nr:DUF4093 domain-containing protein [Clostridia bacterium]
MSGRIRLKIPVIVEGKYDKARLSSVIDAPIFTTDGFAIFKNEEKRALLRKIGGDGVILLCDSDGGGRLIRSHLRGMLGSAPVHDLYTPLIAGKEARKKAPSKAGVLGVEGVPNEILSAIFEKFAAAHPELTAEGGGCPDEQKEKRPVTRALLYELGLNGGPDASNARRRLAKKLGLPPDMTAGAFAAALDLISDEEEVRRLAGSPQSPDAPEEALIPPRTADPNRGEVH